MHEDTAASDEELISQTQTWSTATPPADPWSSDPTVTIPCPDTTFSAQPNGVVIANYVMNRYKQATGRPVLIAPASAPARKHGVSDSSEFRRGSPLSSRFPLTASSRWSPN